MTAFKQIFNIMYDFFADGLSGNAALILLCCGGGMILFFIAALIVFACRRQKQRRPAAYCLAVFFFGFGVCFLCGALTVTSQAALDAVTGINTLLTAALALVLSLISLVFFKAASKKRPAVKNKAAALETETVSPVYAAKNEALPPETEDLLGEIDRIAVEGAPLSKMKEVAELLQKERMKPENQDSVNQQQLSTALSKLLKSMDEAINN